jgi:hypothetical protein
VSVDVVPTALETVVRQDVLHDLVEDQPGSTFRGTRVIEVTCLLLAVPVGPGSSWRLFISVELALAGSPPSLST